jgi:hypothetical protein
VEDEYPAVSPARRPPVRKRHFLSHLYIKINILPRQARDNHRENSKQVPFSLSGAVTALAAIPGKEAPLLRCHFDIEMIIFTKTGSGQT